MDTQFLFEYWTRWETGDPQDCINEMAADGWRLHTVVRVGEDRDGVSEFMIVMEKSVAIPV